MDLFGFVGVFKCIDIQFIVCMHLLLVLVLCGNVWLVAYSFDIALPEFSVGGIFHPLCGTI